ncbi:MAG: hypothetical protein HFI38_03370 [Lachnospiraceae bacterium]|jgi:hypothetical protein|nr:hypothetical protein [Lachnospiraceae bacterium]
MLKREDVLSLGYLKKTTFSGSCQGLRFLLQSEEQDGKRYLHVFVWPEPYAFDYTPDEQKQDCTLEFSEDGICQAVEWINRFLSQT